MTDTDRCRCAELGRPLGDHDVSCRLAWQPTDWALNEKLWNVPQTEETDNP